MPARPPGSPNSRPPTTSTATSSEPMIPPPPCTANTSNESSTFRRNFMTPASIALQRLPIQAWPAAAVVERQTVPGSQPDQRHRAGDRHAMHDDRQDVPRPHQTGIEQRQARQGHEQHERRRGQDSGRIAAAESVSGCGRAHCPPQGGRAGGKRTGAYTEFCHGRRIPPFEVPGVPLAQRLPVRTPRSPDAGRIADAVVVQYHEAPAGCAIPRPRQCPARFPRAPSRGAGVPRPGCAPATVRRGRDRQPA